MPNLQNHLLFLKLDSYYSHEGARVLVNLVYVLSYVCLTLHLLFIPIQIAYFWLLADIDVQLL